MDNRYLERIAAALERISPEQATSFDANSAHAFVYGAHTLNLRPVSEISAIPLSLLKGIDRSLNTLFENTERFAKGFSAYNCPLKRH